MSATFFVILALLALIAVIATAVFVAARIVVKNDPVFGEHANFGGTDAE